MYLSTNSKSSKWKFYIELYHFPHVNQIVVNISITFKNIHRQYNSHNIFDKELDGLHKMIIALYHVKVNYKVKGGINSK